MAVLRQSLARKDLKLMGLGGRLFRTIRWWESPVSMAALGEIGSTAMTPPAATPWIKGPMVV
jgi:hypothetical protein